MSLFKVRDWWSTKVGVEEEFDQGCLCVANIINGEQQDQIITGSFQGMLRIYNPQPTKTDHGWSGFSPQHLLLETPFQLPILQISAGQFVSGTDKLYLAILHPQKLSVYGVTAVTGHVEQGSHYQLYHMYEHNLQRSVYNFCYGPFGNVYGKDFICVQSLDGTVSVFEQESYAFTRFLPAAFIPGPMKYVPSTDSLVTVSSSRLVECYKYQVLAVATDSKTKEESQNIKQGKRVTPHWVYGIEENALDITTITYCAQETLCFILVLGERNIYLLTENGCLHFMKKLEYDVSCFCSYVSNSVKYLVATHAASLLVYQDVELLWAAKMDHTPVHICTGTFQGIKGLVVSLTENGYLQVSYLGSDPDLFTPPMVDSRDVRYDDIDKEITSLNKKIRQLSHKADVLIPHPKESEELTVNADLLPELQTRIIGNYSEYETEHEVSCVSLKIVFKSKTVLENVNCQICLGNHITAEKPEFHLNKLEPNRPHETIMCVYPSSLDMPTSLAVQVCTSYLRPSSGSSRRVVTDLRLPLRLVVKPAVPMKNANYKITIDSNKASLNLNKIFPDLTDPSGSGSNSVVGCEYLNGTIVTILASKSDRYRIQCDRFEAMYILCEELVRRLRKNFEHERHSDFKLGFSSSLPLPEYFELINTHLEHRQEVERCKEELATKAAQFRAIQRRLLIKYKDKSPLHLVGLDILLEETYHQILLLSEMIEGNQRELELASDHLSSGTSLLNLLIRLWYPGHMTDQEFAVLNTVLSPIINNNNHQGWEENVDAAITHMLRTVLAKNTKDTTINPPPFSLPSDSSKVCKHITTFCEKLGKGIKLVPTAPDQKQPAAFPSSPSPKEPEVEDTDSLVAQMDHMTLDEDQ
ncbi:protein PTHB1 isoform X2 [Octopus bimaculoides]|uniref:Protein PTHB1 n=2 Tax=Octopus bimaculoides TaxID=37653 RepID=A0A0L8FPR7_OCTBM|nr:protein PTHB1 isoform X2 [Octopus bimaculoides]XP_014787975.1 protein PTHB1 isoform X2 [Octopus bimaculoides]|eukprot:XP_014787974.1 PREDICTED: protein PTHB1-like [Octopus bimaculoides]